MQNNMIDLAGWGQRLLGFAAVLTLVGCGGAAGGDSQAPDPTVQEQAVAYVKRPVPTDVNGDPVSGNVGRPQDFNPGARLLVKRNARVGAPEIDVTSALIGDSGDVRDPSFSNDGSKLLFALHREDDNVDPPETWDIYEYDLNTPLSQAPGSENPRRILGQDDASGGHDLAPVYVPGNRIVFSSSRAARTKAIQVDEGNQQFSPTIEAANSQTPAFNLHSLSWDGTLASDIRQLTYNMSHDLDPVVIRNIIGLQGKIVFTRWENAGVRSQMSLYSMNPDGTQVRHLYGAHSHATGTGGSQVQFMQPQEISGGEIMVLARSFTGTFDGGDPIRINVATYIDNTLAVNPNSLLTGPAQLSASNNTVRTDPGLSLGGRYNSIIPFMDGTNRALVSYSLCFVEVLDTVSMTTRDYVCNDSRVNLNDPNTTEIPPRYGIFVLDANNSTLTPITIPLADTYYTDVAFAQPLTTPPYIADSYNVSTEPYGILDIRSVYDMDGVFNRSLFTPAVLAEIDQYVTDYCNIPANSADCDTPEEQDNLRISYIANPANATGDRTNHPTLIDRPARFLRVVKGVYLPDNDIRNFNGAAYGVDSSQLMKEIIGYTPIDPDGSVRVRVPADVPLSISIVDRNGRRLTDAPRHNNWITVRPGETVSCNGCHDHSSGSAHGRPDAQRTSINSGASGNGIAFPNTVNTFLINAGDTMAQARVRTLDIATLPPSVDIKYTDLWTNAAVRSIDAIMQYRYNLLDASLSMPVNRISCAENNDLNVDGWTGECRVVINFEEHIHPIWSLARVDPVDGITTTTCTTCHNATGFMSGIQLDLSDGLSDLNARHFKSYRELVSDDNELDTAGGETAVTVTRSVIPGNANGSRFFDVFSNGQHCTDDNGTCVPWLSVHELKMISEWVDIGAQYYNNPFEAPLN